MRALVLSFALVSLGCGSRRAATTPHAPVATTLVVDAGAAATVVAPPPARIPLDTVADAAAQAFSRPEAALAQLDGVDHPLARAWRAYLLAARGDEAGARALLPPPEGDAGATSAVAAALSAMRDAWDETASDANRPEAERLVPCALFVRHPREALAAFAGRHGSMRDAEARAVVTACTAQRVAAALPDEARQRAVRDATRGVLTAVYTVLPLPEQGTLYRAIGMDLGHTLESAYWVTPEGDAAAARRAVDAAAARLEGACGRRVRTGLGRYTQSALPHVSPIAQAIAATAALRDEAVTPARAEDAARALTLRVLAAWLASGSEVCAQLTEERARPQP